MNLAIKVIHQTNGIPQYDPWRCGFTDAIMQRPCVSPWRDLGFKFIRRNTLYLSGYLEGENKRERNNIKRP